MLERAHTVLLKRVLSSINIINHTSIEFVGTYISFSSFHFFSWLYQAGLQTFPKDSSKYQEYKEYELEFQKTNVARESFHGASLWAESVSHIWGIIYYVWPTVSEVVCET